MAIYRIRRFAATEADITRGIQEVSKAMPQTNSKEIQPPQMNEISKGWDAASNIKLNK